MKRFGEKHDSRPNNEILQLVEQINLLEDETERKKADK